MNYREWLAARRASWNRASEIYWLGCEQHAWMKLNLPAEVSALRAEFSALDGLWRAYPCKDVRKNFLQFRNKLWRIQQNHKVREVRFYLSGLRQVTNQLLGKHNGVSNLDVVDLVECFGDGEHSAAYRDEQKFQLDSMRPSFADYDREFAGGWSEYKKKAAKEAA